MISFIDTIYKVCCVYIVFIHTITIAILNKSTHTNMPSLISLSLSSPAGKVTPYIKNIQER